MQDTDLSSLISLLGTSTYLSIFLNCLSSNLQTFVFQPSGSKEFIKLVPSFQLKWNFLLATVSKAMTLCHRGEFGSWHLFHLLLLECVIHIFQSCLKEEDMGNLNKRLSDDQFLTQSDQTLFHPLDSSPPQEYESLAMEPLPLVLKHKSQGWCPVGLSSVALTVLGFFVDTATGNKV
ncbi:PREDICTED: DNA-binding protein RFX8 [Elephantulus edwardii]|uniref:DNA-binding protein RFX8 n=1 Tax=Elephantulus edwardii TaxID=28737 RepID=UPI0003F05814|nr:PREDICTED: DNA-binding protein RFX8 [Elephantulus edwardii]